MEQERSVHAPGITDGDLDKSAAQDDSMSQSTTTKKMIKSSETIPNDADSDVDEEEERDNVDVDEPPVITVQYEIKILCAKSILLADGTQLRV